MPQPIARPRHVPWTGSTTAASPGPSSFTPTRGLRTLPPCPSGSFRRIVHSLAHPFRPAWVGRKELLGFLLFSPPLPGGRRGGGWGVGPFPPRGEGRKRRLAGDVRPALMQEVQV